MTQAIFLCLNLKALCGGSRPLDKNLHLTERGQCRTGQSLCESQAKTGKKEIRAIKEIAR